MQAVTDFLNNFPVVTFTVVALIIAGVVKTIAGDLDYSQLVSLAEKVLIGGGALGAARGIVDHARVKGQTHDKKPVPRRRYR